MSLGSRIVNRGKAAVVASLTSTPREPLLFLYPLLGRNTSTIALRSTRDRNGDSSTSFSRSYTSTATIPSNSADGVEVDTIQNTHPIEKERDLLSRQTSDSRRDEDEPSPKNCTPDAADPGPYGVEIAVSNPRHKLYLAEQEMFKKRNRKTLHTRKHAEEAFKKRIKKTIGIREQAENSALFKRRARKVYQEVRREEKESWEPDWRIIMGDLRKGTPWHPKWFDKAVSISVPASANGKLLRGIDDNIWDIAGRYDCSVTLGKPDEETGEYNEFILSGSGLAISKTAAEAIRIAPGSKVKNVPQSQTSVDSSTSTTKPAIDSKGALNPSLRYVKSETNGMKSAVRAEDVPKPVEWTIDSFADYVDRLTSMQMSNHKHHLLYKAGEEHVKVVTKILRGVFTDPECKSSLSRTAFKTALDYFVKTSNIADARAIFVLMDMMGTQMDPEAFNILLRGAAKKEDLHNFHFILHLMLRRGVSPNGWTWVAFLMANNDSRIKKYIVAEMEAKGLLAHPAVLRKVCQELVIQEVNASLDLGQSQDEFLKHMDSCYGKDWLTVDTGNRILQALGARSLISRCWEFLQVMASRFVNIDHVSINTILNHCKQQANAVGAIDIMRVLPTLIPYEPDSHTYHALFEIAWRKRSHNLARVVWKYACLNAATTSRMRMLVAQSLANAAGTPEPESSQSKRWRQQAGFVISNDVFEHPLSWRGPVDCSNGVDADNSNEQESRPGLRQALSRQAVTEHLERDYNIFRTWKPARPFGEELMKAWELDRTWQRERMRTVEGEQLDWKVHEAIPVLVLSRHSKGYEDLTLDWR
ncbi:hypothetical protein D0Z07_1041 [Hyphodiscus hymeniophilus]|uniref:Pentatricopeptide repeat-containing protein n=1 Tax=Hyphodiscus hymeniophilus TaxID=353542 RepID=A0A9P6VPS2_9HELO|nr:hypothetical protein D0Z07_1041 [Hyphodiscus hymeniophilus]